MMIFKNILHLSLAVTVSGQGGATIRRRLSDDTNIFSSEVSTTTTTKELFPGEYDDPNHINCQRIVEVQSDGSAIVGGTDGDPNCPEDGSGDEWKVVGEVEGNTILVDFSSKGGPADIKGVWENQSTAGIRWADCNKWTATSTTTTTTTEYDDPFLWHDGNKWTATATITTTTEYDDPNHLYCKRTVVVKPDGSAKVSGTDGTPDCPEDGSGDEWEVDGEVHGNTILVDFSSKGGPEDLEGVWENNPSPAGIRWPDGNKWTVKDS